MSDSRNVISPPAFYEELYLLYLINLQVLLFYEEVLI